MDPSGEFSKVAQSEQEAGLLHEFLLFLRQNKKWWLLPLVLVLLVLGLLTFLSSSAAAPFIYTLF
jgi:hypothetical protein